MENEWQLIHWSKWDGYKVFHLHKDIKLSCYKYYKFKCSLCNKPVPKHILTQVKILEIKIPHFSPELTHKVTSGFFIFENEYKARYNISKVDDRVNIVPSYIATKITKVHLNIVPRIKQYIEDLRHELENKV